MGEFTDIIVLCAGLAGISGAFAYKLHNAIQSKNENINIKYDLIIGSILCIFYMLGIIAIGYHLETQATLLVAITCFQISVMGGTYLYGVDFGHEFKEEAIKFQEFTEQIGNETDEITEWDSLNEGDSNE